MCNRSTRVNPSRDLSPRLVPSCKPYSGLVPSCVPTFKFAMAEEFWSYHLKDLSRLVQFHRTTLLLVCVLHFIFSPVATFGNILAIRALWKASSMPANIKKLFLSLAVSDLAVGLFAQLMLAVVLRMAANGGHDFDLLCPTILTVCSFSLFLLACASLLNVTAIAVDRLLAITCHFKARRYSLGINMDHKWIRCFSVRFA